MFSRFSVFLPLSFFPSGLERNFVNGPPPPPPAPPPPPSASCNRNSPDNVDASAEVIVKIFSSALHG